MADKEQIKIVQQGSTLWNNWRKKHPQVVLDLSYANLSMARLNGANLSHVNFGDFNWNYLIFSEDWSCGGVTIESAQLAEANLRGVNLSGANLMGANLSRTKLNSANLSHADLTGANLMGADLSGTDLTGANLSVANLMDADLSGTDFLNAIIGWTTFGDNDLRKANGLEHTRHEGPSTIGMDTLMRSEGDIPVSFLKGAGVSDMLIEYARSLVGRAIEYYTCFISYSSQDHAFAERLYTDLQNKGVRCWFAPEDMETGDIIRDRIDQSIRLYDKLLLVLSEHSVQSKWVRFEVEAALDKEREGKPPVLFPIRLDDAVINSSTSWAAHIQRTRHITDFSKWKLRDDYQTSFTRLLRDLQPDKTSTGE